MITPSFIEALIRTLDFIAIEGDGLYAIAAGALGIAVTCLVARIGFRLACKLLNRGIGA